MVGAMDDEASRPAKGRRGGPKKATRRHLENAAEYYIARFASSADNLKRVLMRLSLIHI